MKLIIEFYEHQENLLETKRGDLPLTTFLKKILKLKSVELLDEEIEEVTEITTTEHHWLYHDLYELDRELGTI